MVFLSLHIRQGGLAGPFDGSLERVLLHIHITALVRAAEDIDLNAEPEKEKPGSLSRPWTPWSGRRWPERWRGRRPVPLVAPRRNSTR